MKSPRQIHAFAAPLVLALPFVTVARAVEPSPSLTGTYATEALPRGPLVAPARVVAAAAPVPAGLPRRTATQGTPGVSACGVTLCLDGRPHRFVGVNAYELATLWSVNAGCGSQVTSGQIDDLFRKLPRHSLIRFWAFQAQAFENKSRHRIDFRTIDRIVDAAERRDQHLVMTLTDQAGTCDDGHWKDAAWYRGGYRRSFDDHHRHVTPLPYLSYVRSIVRRYASSPAIAMWEPVNEPEASSCGGGFKGWDCWGHLSCPSGGAAAMRSFFDTVGRAIHAIDRVHPISSGALGGDQCGWTGTGYSMIHASRGIDVASVHDYGSDSIPIPGYVRTRIAQARALGKPIIAGEVGLKAGGSCQSRSTRASRMRAKLRAQRNAGVAAFLMWGWMPSGSAPCTHEFTSSDPIMAVLRA